MTQAQQPAAIYARFSTDLQNESSITDQFTICQRAADHQKLKVVKKFSDSAKSGATLWDRDGLQAMMKAARQGEFKVLVIECLDRLSRDLGDLPSLYKELKFHGVTIHTTNEGVANNVLVGLRAIVNEMFLDDVANKVRRSSTGITLQGRIPGAVPYGYRMIPGKPGEVEIDREQAKIVLRIFMEYASGRSPRAIAMDLTNEGVPGPSVGSHRKKGDPTTLITEAPWNSQYFIGGYLKHGMIGNRLYVGELVRNATRSIRHYTTRKTTKRAAPPEDLVRVPMPHLRIVPQELFNAANAMRESRAKKRFGADGKMRITRNVISRDDYLLGGLLRCDVCGGHMRICVKNGGKYAGQRVGCAAAHQNDRCTHRRTYELAKLTRGVVEFINTNFANPEILAEYAKAFEAERSARQKHIREDRAGLTKRRDRLEFQISRVLAAIRETDKPSKRLAKELETLEAEAEAVETKLQMLEQESNVVTLHPKAIDKCIANIKALVRMLTEDIANPEARMAIHNLVDYIVVHPTAKRADYEMTPYLRLGALMGGKVFPTKRTSTAKRLENEGVTFFDNVEPEVPGATLSKKQVVCLGRWQVRAA